ncbi:MAG: prepilin-type N-terminal cleavage/methylation domain-containing protein [Trueperaceae bacterium]|nr:prepilin-type N-terminal cleavage/methylation domain-containing protein [Trueperaceae bacterium]
MRNVRGFSVLELIIVIAMVSVLIGLAAPGYLEWRANTTTAEAAQQLASDILGQRTEAKRENAVRRVTAAADSTSYTLESVDDAGNVTDTRVIELPNGTRITAVPSVPRVTPDPTSTSTSPPPPPISGVVFAPPYGTITEPLSTFTVVWASDTSIDRDVNVVGVMGKVVIE